MGLMLFLTTIFYLNFLTRVIIAPLMPTIEKELDISHGEAGYLFLLISIGYFSSMIGSGFITSKLNHRKTISLSSTALGLTLIAMSFCNSLWSLSVGVLLIGLATGIYLPSGVTTLTTAINPRHWGKAMGIHELGPSLGFLSAPLITQALLSRISWHGILLLLGTIALVLGLFFFRFGKGGDFPGEAPKAVLVKQILKARSFWFLVFFFGLGVSGSLGIYTMLPLYLIAGKGFEQNWANWLVSISRIGSPAMVFLAGWIADALGARKTISITLLLTGLATVFLGLTQGSWLVLFIFLQPLFASCFFPAGFATLSKNMPDHLRSLGVAFTISTAFVIGGGLTPTMIGLAGDFASFAVGITATGIFLLSGAFLYYFLTHETD